MHACMHKHTYTDQVMFVTPSSEDARLDVNGKAAIVVRWPGGTVSNVTKLLAYADGCAGQFGMLGEGADCRSCPTGNPIWTRLLFYEQPIVNSHLTHFIVFNRRVLSGSQPHVGSAWLLGV